MNRSARKTETHDGRLNRTLFGLGAAFSIAWTVVTVVGQDGLLRLWELSVDRDRIRSENHRVLLDNLRLTEEIHRLKQPRVIEQRARSDMGLVRPDEVVYVLPE